ncbi:MAG TPA: tRNA glutamyl-Q(34) synthetase GluQRS [Solirubrobacteraceae bacterium]|nr:tRNA glutamyl-Q(34) synthetase GluQRS [Solirubrobacteraceae bacterium]
MSADGRFAPSPSGPLHLGNLRTALLAWCFARAAGGRFLLRIEDLDPQRSQREREPGIRADLARIGIDWDAETVRQSERADAHRSAFAALRDAGALYRCWCTRAEIREAASAPHGSPSGAYPGTCRRLGAAEIAQRERDGRPAAWRVDAGQRRVSFKDGLHGETAAWVDDFVVWRELDDLAAYNLAVVVDDAADDVGEVVRGDDLLETTPRQILVADLLGLPVPAYAHVPLVLGGDGARLAKRHGAITLDERLERGEGAEAVVGWLASSAGLAPDGARLTADEVLQTFERANVSRDPAVLTARDPRGQP